MNITNVRFKKKEVDSNSIPKKAKILFKDKSFEVEEIENGYLILIRTEVKYQFDGKTDYSYNTKKVYSETNPIEIDTDAIEEKMLADYFQD